MPEHPNPSPTLVDAVQFSLAHGYPPIALSPSGVWRHMRVAHHRRDSPEIEQPSHRQVVVSLNLSGPTYVERHQGGKIEAARWPAHAVGIHPPGSAARWVYPEPFDFQHIVLEPALLAETAQGAASKSRPIEIISSINQVDPVLEHLGLLLDRELEAGCLSTHLYGDALATALAAHLLRSHAAFPTAFREYARGLGKSDLRRVLDFIGDRLADDIALADLAACVSLSPYHFCRLFKLSTGQSPHQYVIAQRVEKAKGLLLRGGLTVGEVAQAVGFSDHSKLHLHFKRLTGLTPGQFSKR